MINLIIVISLILVLIAFIGTPLIVKVLATGFEGEQFNLAVKLTRTGLPIITFSGLLGVLMGYLQSEQSFNSTAIIGIPFNFVYIFYLIVLSSMFRIRGLMVTAVIATFTKVLLQIPEIKKKWL